MKAFPVRNLITYYLLAGWLLAGVAFGQGSMAPSGAAGPTVSFVLDFPTSSPQHYELEVGSNGDSIYRSTGKLTPEAEGDPFEIHFVASPASVEKIFRLAAKAGHFQKPVAYTKGNLAFTGNKTLSYRENGQTSSQTFNYSAMEPVQDLVRLLQNIATTLEFGRRLTYYRSYQKLALDEETRRLEEMLKSQSAAEPGAIAPILRGIADDKTVIHMVRERSERLLALTGAPAAR